MPFESEKQKMLSALCENYVFDIAMVESDEEDEVHESFATNVVCLLHNRRSVHLGVPKSAAWQQKVLTGLDNNRFQQMVRVSPAEFYRILELIEENDVFNTKSHATQLPIELQLKIVLFRLGSSGDGLSIRKIASLFGVGDGGTIKNVTKRVFKAILSLRNRFLFWPNETERQQLFSETSHEMPGCIGYIDGSEIKLAEAPTKNHALYFSRKRQYAIKIQAVCDHKLRIRQVTVGYPGSVHDAKIFYNCPLSKHTEQFLSNSEWVAGDSAYPLKPYLITPFRQNSSDHTREEREKFNKYFAKYRVRIENCFGVLKEKFSSLKELKFRMLSEENKKECNDWIMVCCILHNIIINVNAEKDEAGTQILQPNLDLPPSTSTRNTLMRFIENQTDSLID